MASEATSVLYVFEVIQLKCVINIDFKPLRPFGGRNGL